MLQPQVGKTDAGETGQTLKVDAGRQTAEAGDADVGQLRPLPGALVHATARCML